MWLVGMHVFAQKSTQRSLKYPNYFRWLQKLYLGCTVNHRLCFLSPTAVTHVHFKAFIFAMPLTLNQMTLPLFQWWVYLSYPYQKLPVIHFRSMPFFLVRGVWFISRICSSIIISYHSYSQFMDIFLDFQAFCTEEKRELFAHLSLVVEK